LGRKPESDPLINPDHVMLSIMVDFGVSLPTGREGLMVPTGFASRETIVEAGVAAEELCFYRLRIVPSRAVLVWSCSGFSLS
jgi:hypothetical protein